MIVTTIDGLTQAFVAFDGLETVFTTHVPVSKGEVLTIFKLPNGNGASASSLLVVVIFKPKK